MYVKYKIKYSNIDKTVLEDFERFELIPATEYSRPIFKLNDYKLKIEDVEKLKITGDILKRRIDNAIKNNIKILDLTDLTFYY